MIEKFKIEADKAVTEEDIDNLVFWWLEEYAQGMPPKIREMMTCNISSLKSAIK